MNISRPISDYIADVSINNPEDSPSRIHELALLFAAEIGDETLRRDQSATVARRVRDARRNLGEQDVQWGLNGNPELLDQLVPVDARRDVLDVSIWHQVGGTKFTIRQAKWVGRLRGSFPRRSKRQYYTFDLAYYAMLYASWERACLAIGSELDTGFLDIELAEYQEAKPKAGRTRQLLAMHERIKGKSWQNYQAQFPENLRQGVVFDELALTISRLCPEIKGQGFIKVEERGMFGPVVLRLRRDGGEEFLNSSKEDQQATVDHFYHLASLSEKYLIDEEWPQDWDE